MLARLFLAIAGLAGAVSVAIEAFARHALAGDAYHQELVSIAARYGLLHAVALLGLALFLLRTETRFLIVAAGFFFVLGLLLFCGTLDLIALGGPAGLVVLTPWGGTAFIVGWIALFLAALRIKPAR